MSNIRIYTDRDVLEAARHRLRLIFEEFPNILVYYSGGKDSTVVLELALEVALECGRLPLNVAFIDQETEHDYTIDMVEWLLERPELKVHWYQVPIRLSNSSGGEWFYPWEPGKEEEWIRPKHPKSIHENQLGTKSFYQCFDRIPGNVFGADVEKVACIGGVRAEESPQRSLLMSNYAAYKWMTYGKTLNSKQQWYTLYPIYDWAYGDVWKYIHDYGHKYNPIYDYQYRYNIPVQKMRVSSIIHETALEALNWIKEVEPQIWNRLATRVKGANTHRVLGELPVPENYPSVFNDWHEYRDYLAKHLLNDEERPKFVNKFDLFDKKFGVDDVDYMRTCVRTILGKDFTFIFLDGLRLNKDQSKYIKDRAARKAKQ